MWEKDGTDGGSVQEVTNSDSESASPELGAALVFTHTV